MSQTGKRRLHHWHRGKMKEDLMDLAKGSPVVFKKSYEPLSVGIVWWVLGGSSKERAFVLYRVAESYGGKNLEGLIQVARDRTTGRALRAPRKLHNRYSRLCRSVRRKAQASTVRKVKNRVQNTPIRSAPL